MAESNKTNSCIEKSSNIFYKTLQYIVVILITIIIVIPICFFYIHTTNEAHDDHGLKTNEKMVAAIDSLESNCIALDSVQLRHEVMQVKKLTKYLIERESNYQMEIDMIIDKYSQWTGCWLSIISIVLTLFTIIQALLNHRINNEMEKTFDNTIKNFKSSIYHNNLSCISACLSTFPDAFSFSPNEERKKFIQTFMKMLSAEYSEFTKHVSKMTKEGTNMEFDFCEEIRYIYLAWCDISIAINKASLDYTETRQIVAFEDLKESLSTAIIMYHNGGVISTNVAKYMRRIQNNIESVVNMI